MRDSQQVCNILLRFFFSSHAKAVFHDFSFPLSQRRNGAEQRLSLLALLNPARGHVPVGAKDVRQQELIAVPVHRQGLVDGDVMAQVVCLPQRHQDFILDAARGIGGQLNALGGLEGVDGLDEPDGANGDEVLHADSAALILSRNIDHQPQVVFDELVAHGGIAGGQAGQQFGLALPRERRGQRVGPVDVVHRRGKKAGGAKQKPQKCKTQGHHHGHG